MQPRDRVERGEHGALLPSRDVGGMLAGQHDPSVEGAEIVVVLLARGIAPLRKAAERCRLAMPADRDAVLEFLCVLRMDLCAEFHRLLDPFGRSKRGPLERMRAERIRAEQHALAGVEVPAAWILYDGIRQIRVGDAAIDLLVLLPEPAP